MPTTKLDKVIINGLTEETATKPVLVWNPATRRVSWQASPNARIAALEAKLDTNNNFKSIPDPGYTFNAGTRVLTMNANWVGTINGIDYTNPAEQVFPAIPLAASGYSRIDLIVFDTDANFERIAGVESLFTPVAPLKPLNTLEASFLTVGDGYVNAPVIPKTKAPVTSVNGMRGDVVIPTGLATIITTVKTITSASLATQDVAGFVAYINALAVVLVVGANEIVEYQLSDTGRVFKLLLRGRSFGVGQAAIVAADVVEDTLWMQKDLKLSNYPSTRNDGALSTNKILTTDATGNVKLCTMAVMPAPYLEVLIPDSTLPSTTTNFVLKGSFFTPTMTVVIAGQTINSKTFISDNEVRLGITTGAIEGSFSVTLNNGISATFPGALLIVLGTIYEPTAADWVSKINIDVSVPTYPKIIATGVTASAKWVKPIDITKNFIIVFFHIRSPYATGGESTFFSIYDTVTNLPKMQFRMIGMLYEYYNGNGTLKTSGINFGAILKIKKVGSLITFYINDVLVTTPSTLPGINNVTLENNLDIRVSMTNSDISGIKYIEIA